jgi:ergothioneine biosynthesis protein EgtB
VAEADSAQRRASLRRAFADVRSLTEALAAPLGPEDQTVQSMPDVSPTKWHRGHTSWFFETFVLSPEVPGYAVYHPAYGYIFNSYYEAVGERHPRPERGLVSRPGVEAVARYRRHVDEAMQSFLEHPRPSDVLDLVELGINHEQQHQELLLMDIKHVLSRNPLLPAYAGGDDTAATSAHVSTPAVPLPSGSGEPAKLGWLEHQGGVAEVGHRGSGFGFDNESPLHAVQLVPFALADRLVTCGEWLAFIQDDGYSRPDLWLSEGWALVQAERWTAPLYWMAVDPGAYRVFTLCGERELDASEPVVHVSYYEADAYARWNGARLPTEAEWETVAADELAPGTGRGRYALHPSAEGGDLLQLFGDVWQWTTSAYSAYPGFRPAAGAVGEYNGKFMVNQQVLRGSACITPPGHARPTYRNFFPAAARWAFSGLRLARDL